MLCITPAACVFGLRIARARRSRGERSASGGMTPLRAFAAGAGLTVVGMPVAIPYFAAIDLVLRADVVLVRQLGALLYYNLVFVAPLAAIVALRLVLGERGARILDAVKRFFDTWGQRVIVALLMGLGVVLVVDGIGWFLGLPLIPV